jgi:hypothetical protein
MRLPPLGDTWDGIWITKGFDERPPLDEVVPAEAGARSPVDRDTGRVVL